MRSRVRANRPEDQMRPFHCLIASMIVTGLIADSQVAFAQAQDNVQQIRQQIDQLRKDFETLRQQYGDRLAALEAKLASLPGGQSAPAPPGGAAAAPSQTTAPVPPGAEGAGGPSGSLPVYGAAVAGSKVFNPDIAVIGDFLGGSGPNKFSSDPALALHESEASFQAVVDPYARADCL